MDITVEKFKLKKSAFMIGSVHVRYGLLLMRCELAYYPKESKAWIRMPEIWRTKDLKKRICWWPEKIISDAFQEVVLKQIFEKYDLNLEKIKELYKIRNIKIKKNGVKPLKPIA